MPPINWPLNTAPGLRPQDGAGRLINVYAEPRPNGVGTVWRRVPGTITFTNTYPASIAFTGTATVSWVGVNTQGALSATGTGTATIVAVPIT